MQRGCWSTRMTPVEGCSSICVSFPSLENSSSPEVSASSLSARVSVVLKAEAVSFTCRRGAWTSRRGRSLRVRRELFFPTGPRPWHYEHPLARGKLRLIVMSGTSCLVVESEERHIWQLDIVDEHGGCSAVTSQTRAIHLKITVDGELLRPAPNDPALGVLDPALGDEPRHLVATAGSPVADDPLQPLKTVSTRGEESSREKQKAGPQHEPATDTRHRLVKLWVKTKALAVEDPHEPPLSRSWHR